LILNIVHCVHCGQAGTLCSMKVSSIGRSSQKPGVSGWGAGGRWVGRAHSQGGGLVKQLRQRGNGAEGAAWGGVACEGAGNAQACLKKLRLFFSFFFFSQFLVLNWWWRLGRRTPQVCLPPSAPFLSRLLLPAYQQLLCPTPSPSALADISPLCLVIHL
jgi:hypothetical protein